MSGLSCKDCEKYIQHYIFLESKIVEVNCGHCIVAKRPRQKKPKTKACENFVQGYPVPEAFVSREYLTKALLNRVLSMDTLPEIWKL